MHSLEVLLVGCVPVAEEDWHLLHFWRSLSDLFLGVAFFDGVLNEWVFVFHIFIITQKGGFRPPLVTLCELDPSELG